MSRFPFRTPPKDPKAWKTHGFLTLPRWNLETAKATKPCKKRWFLNTTRRIHCKLQGTAPGPANRNRHEVSTRWSAAGAASVYNLRLPPKASGEDTGAGPAPGFMRLTPDSRAPAKADPWKVCVGWNPCSGSQSRQGSMSWLWLLCWWLLLVWCYWRFGGCLCCCCCWPMLALFGRRFAPVLALGWPM